MIECCMLNQLVCCCCWMFYAKISQKVLLYLHPIMRPDQVWGGLFVQPCVYPPSCKISSHYRATPAAILITPFVMFTKSDCSSCRGNKIHGAITDYFIFKKYKFKTGICSNRYKPDAGTSGFGRDCHIISRYDLDKGWNIQMLPVCTQNLCIWVCN